MSTEVKIKFEVTYSQRVHGEWVVEGIDRAGEGECYLAIFTGPKAEKRAEQYAAWMNCHPEDRDRNRRLLEAGKTLAIFAQELIDFTEKGGATGEPTIGRARILVAAYQEAAKP